MGACSPRLSRTTGLLARGKGKDPWKVKAKRCVSQGPHRLLNESINNQTMTGESCAESLGVGRAKCRSQCLRRRARLSLYQ